ncbi:MAG: hypothetical protein A2X23_10990 [Chloroflexi bacterium GWC2_73_18]|nr:MAG: hypothetical protein A2X23_10990 [Chloroflexi bacterium GWC2_73_18]
MTAARRLARLDGALCPTAAILLWLEEAHRFGSLPAYVTWLLDQPLSAAPLVRVPEQAEAAVLQAMRGQPREAVRQAARQAVRGAVFLVEFVIQLNRAAEETTRLEGLRHAALFWQWRALTLEAELAAADAAAGGRAPAGTLPERWRAWCGAVADLLTELYATEEARGLLERRYLDGHPALFPDAARDWQALREQAERLAALGGSLAVSPPERPGRRGRPELDLDALRTAARALAPAQAADLADLARAAALDLLGDADGAAALAERRLRTADV